MSLRFLNRAWETRCDSPAEKLVLLALADHADENGFCYPGQEYLTKRTGLCERQIRAMIKLSEIRRRLYVDHRRGRKRTNNYVVLLEPTEQEKKQAAVAAFTPGKGEIHDVEKRQSFPKKEAATSHPLYPSMNRKGNQSPPRLFPKELDKAIEDQRRTIRQTTDAKTFDALWVKLWELETQKHGAPVTKRPKPKAPPAPTPEGVAVKDIPPATWKAGCNAMRQAVEAANPPPPARRRRK